MLTLLLLGAHFGLLFGLTRDGGQIEGFFPFGLIVCTWLVVTLLHLIVSVVGLVRASGGRVFQVPAIPFLKA
ncbi:hypothetical protein [Nocardioides sambongensis]|uniref:hypothetical protein n=1 Tax=Nocardioides sambongensis TaxID=2589074 RepID=UPI001128BB7F|nr:hypothetical protein [Nocardioides sambongensis]